MRDATNSRFVKSAARKISIHASHAGRDIAVYLLLFNRRFQSTRPMRDATFSYCSVHESYTFQSTRPMRDATANKLFKDLSMIFQSTRPMRDATAIYTNLSRFLRLFLCYRNTILRY